MTYKNWGRGIMEIPPFSLIFVMMFVKKVKQTEKVFMYNIQCINWAK